MKLIYENSRGKEINLLSTGIRLKTANLSGYKWDYESRQRQYGIDISKFTKGTMEYDVEIVFRGTQKERRERLEEFCETTEADILSKTPGKLKKGTEYINCYIISSSTEPGDRGTWAIKNATILAPYPFWIQEISQEFYPQREVLPEDGLDYPHDYRYDYTGRKKGIKRWHIDHYTGSEFKMTIYGACTDPRITINGYPYEVYDTLEKNEYIEIDSRGNTVKKYLSNGAVKDIYDLRAKGKSIFEKIPEGDLQIAWSGDFGFTITLYLERSEHRWTVN